MTKSQGLIIATAVAVLVLIIGSPAFLMAQETDAPTAVDSKTELAEQILNAKRIVILGDSNTHAGEYVVQLEATLLANHAVVPEIINLGLPSETCSGLSEPIHPFPRPNVHERLDRALEKTKPDIVLACYGMNDGIYHPFDEMRFAKFKAGVNQLIGKVDAAGAKLVLLTPPSFDPLPYSKKGKLVSVDGKEFSWKTIYENYDAEVMAKYAQWVLEQKGRVLAVVDTHGPVTSYLLEKRKNDPEFSCSNDGVHFDATGHQVFAKSILSSLGLGGTLTDDEALLKLVRQRQGISHAAWLSHVGHLRPGVAAGLPLDEAEKKMEPISGQINALLKTKASK